MPREKPPPEPPGDVPKWFMTYSDVITLMMTFFILLLTFATNEPERFEKMKITMFGGSGASGLAGEKADGIDRDSWAMRVRPRAARLTSRGTEMPPVERDAALGDVDEGLLGLEDEIPQMVDEYTIDFPGHQFASSSGELFSYGIVNLRMFAGLLKKKAFELTFEFSDRGELNRAIALVDFLIKSEAVSFDRVGIQLSPDSSVPPGHIRVKFKDYHAKQNVQTQEENRR